MSRILIGVPTYENIYPDTFKSIYDLETGDNETIFEFSRGYDVATARNNIVTMAKNYDVDYIFFVDNDVVLQNNTLLKLLESMEHGRQVIMGYYANRGNNATISGRTCVCNLYDENGGLYFNYPTESEYTAKELFDLRNNKEFVVEIHGGGMGCALVRKSVFDTIPYPWFNWIHYADDAHGVLSEDLYFCEQCKARGINIYVDTRCEVGHIMREIKWPE